MRSLFFLLMCTLMYTTTSAQSSLSVKCEIEAKIPCAGARVGALKVNVKGGKRPYQYVWSDTKLKGRRPRNISAGTYTVTVIDARGTSKSATVTLEEPPFLFVFVDEIVGTSEKGARDGRVRVDARGGVGPFEYKWDNDATTQTLISLPEGKYNVTVTDKYNCRALAEISVDPPKIKDVVIEEEVVISEPEVVPKPEVQPESEPEPEAIVAVQELSTATDLEVGQVLQVEKLYFKADAADIKEESYPVLDDIYNFLISNNVVVEIGGHTNSIPSEEYCLKLSNSRAKTVAEYLYSKGIPLEQVSYKGYGKAEPIADNDTAQGRKRNQRVEIKILEVKGE